MRLRLPPWLSDWAPAVIVAAIAAGPPQHSQGVAGRLFALAMGAVLVWRRRHPRAVFAILAALALVQVIANIRSSGDLALLVALYTIAVTQPRQWVLAAAAVIELGIVLFTLRWARPHVEQSLIALNGLGVAATVLGVNIRNRRALVDSLRDRAARLELERDQQGRLAAAAERAHIAREMHDIVAHNLSVMIALADGAAYAVRDAPERAADAMENVARTGRQALTEMRRLLGVLREGEAEAMRAPQPGLAEIEGLVAQVRAAGLPVLLVVEGDSWASLPQGLQLTAYRIVQEALTNTLKHGGPGAGAEVRLAARGDELRVEIIDTGVGGGGALREGGGLRGMRERASVYGGRVQAGALAGGGWRVATTLSALAEAVR